MASSTIDIANRALTKLGEARILSLTDGTRAAATLNSMFAQVRDAELRRHYWNFALKRSSVLALADSPEWGYLYQYPLPADFLQLVQVGEFYVRPSTKNKGPWRLEGTDTGGQVIVTDMTAPLRIRYVKRVENSGLFDPLFVEALACKLAFEACETLTQSASKKSSASEEYKFALSEAARCGAIENPPDEFPRGSWLDAREDTIDGSGLYLGGYVPPTTTTDTGTGGGTTPVVVDNYMVADYFVDGYYGTA